MIKDSARVILLRLTTDGHKASRAVTAEILVTILGEMTDADKRINQKHFGSDPVDIHIWIQINPKIGI